jgi:hypothetical protein
MDKWTEDVLKHTMYQRFIGKIMFCMVKIFPEGADAARELHDTSRVQDDNNGKR